MLCGSLSAFFHKDLGFVKPSRRCLVKGSVLPSGCFCLPRSLSCLVALDGSIAYLGVDTLVRT